MNEFRILLVTLLEIIQILIKKLKEEMLKEEKRGDFSKLFFGFEFSKF